MASLSPPLSLSLSQERLIAVWKQRENENYEAYIREASHHLPYCRNGEERGS